MGTRLSALQHACEPGATGAFEVSLRATSLFSIPSVWEAVVETAPRGLAHTQLVPRDPSKPKLHVSAEMIDERLVLRISEVEQVSATVMMD